MLLWILALACTTPPAEPYADVDGPAPFVAPVERPGLPSPVDATPAPDPATLYADCRDRIELPEDDGECTADADCATSGCGSEVCLPASRQGEVMTTCEERLCFRAVDACTCQAGRCQWTLKDAVPPLGGLPVQLP